MSSNSKKTNQPKILFLVIAVIIMVGLLANIISNNQETVTEVKFSEFKKIIESPETDDDRIIEATFKENHLTGIRTDRSKVKTYVPNDEATRKYLEENEVSNFRKDQNCGGLFLKI